MDITSILELFEGATHAESAGDFSAEELEAIRRFEHQLMVSLGTLGFITEADAQEALRRIEIAKARGLPVRARVFASFDLTSWEYDDPRPFILCAVCGAEPCRCPAGGAPH